MRGERVELRGVCVSCVQNFTRDVHHRALHAQAEPEIGHEILPRISRRQHLSLDAAMAESARDHDAIDLRERRGILVELLRVDPNELQVDAALQRGMTQRLGDADVRVGHLHVFAHHRDAHGWFRRGDACAQVLPIREVGGLRGQPE